MDAQVVAAFEAAKPTSKYNKVETGPLTITVKGDRVTVNNRTFAASMITSEKLITAGYTPEQASEIINVKCKG